MSPPDDLSLISKVADYAWAAILALGGLVWKSQGDKIKDVSDEVTRQRDNISKIFDKLESHANRAEDRHHELIKALHDGLSRKADR